MITPTIHRTCHTLNPQIPLPPTPIHHHTLMGDGYTNMSISGAGGVGGSGGIPGLMNAVVYAQVVE
ncbi:hypothetical protein EON65_28475 [archaeon]|nr:MAG: hypothetical protein EON65_28475 [archaeon]